MIQGFGKEIVEIPAFGHDITEVRAMGELVWQTSIPDYLCFTALEAGTFTLTIGSGVTTTNLQYIEYSLDGRNWTKTDNVNSTEIVITTPQMSAGDKVYWRGKGQVMSSSYSANNYSLFSSNQAGTSDEMSFDASGNIMSLLTDNFSDSMTWSYTTRTFCRLFMNTAIRHAKDMIIPLTHIGYYGCIYMFVSSSIVSAPKMAPTRLGAQALNSMFAHCASLTDVSALDFSGVTQFDLYSGYGRNFYVTFSGCSSLTAAPILPTINPVNGTYLNTFTGCTSLTYIKCLATDLSATDAFTNWLSNASTTGTFIQAEGVAWPRTVSGIPTGWLAYDDGEDIPNDYTPCDYILNPSSVSAAAVAIGTTSGINEPFEVDFQATEIVASDRPVAGYGSSNTSVSPVQGSMSYFYLRNNPDSFQHQVFRLNTSGDAIASTNGLLKNSRDLDRHTTKVTYTYNESTGHYLRNLYFDGALTHSSTTVHPTPLIGTEFYVFGFSSSGSRFINGKIYGLRWWEEDEVTLKANLIPCSRNSDGAAGFWDTAQEKFFTSTYWTAHFDNE